MQNFSNEIVKCFKLSPELFSQSIDNQVQEIESFMDQYESLRITYNFNSGFNVLINEFDKAFESNLPEKCLYILGKLKENFNLK